MRATLGVRYLSLIALVATTWSDPSLAAWPLQCQAQAQFSKSAPPVEVQFQALVAGGNEPIAFHWDFGDGEFSTEQNPTHTYTETAFYQAILTVTDSSFPEEVCRDSSFIHVGFIVDPNCLSSASTTWDQAPAGVQFEAWPGFVFDPEPYTWTWTFGDGATSNQQHPQHVYSDVGTYWAMVTMHTPRADYECWQGPIRISATPPPAGLGPAQPAASLRLEPARPNPSAVLTTLAFELSRGGPVRLTIVDAAGRSVATLVDGVLSAGPHVGLWRGVTDAGTRAPAGLYYARLVQEDQVRQTAIVRIH